MRNPIISLSSTLALIALSTISMLVLNACTQPVSGEGSLSFNLEVNQIYRVGIDVDEIRTMSILGDSSIEVTKSEWELSIKPISQDEETVTLEVTIDAVSMFMSQQMAIILPTDFELLKGKTFTAVLNDSGEIMELDGVNAIREEFLKEFDVRERTLSLMKGNGMIDRDVTLEHIESDSSLNARISQMEGSFEKIISSTVEMYLAESAFSEIMKLLFISTTDRAVTSGSTWTHNRYANRVLHAELPTEVELKLDAVTDRAAEIAVETSSSSSEPQDVYSEMLGAMGMGLGMSMSEVTSTGSGELEIDLQTGLPNSGRITIESEGTLTFNLSEDLASIAQRSIEPAPFSEEIEIEIRRLN